MSTPSKSSRRSFIAVAGAALSAPVAAAATFPATVEHADPLKTRLEQLEDVSAIRALNQDYARHVSARAHEQLTALFADPAQAILAIGVSGITADVNDDDVIEVAADRRTATARLRRTVHRETAIGPSCTLVEMARLQGGGTVAWTEAGVFEHVYVRRDGVWKFQSIRQHPASLRP